jgi:DNA polymerase-3 subunit chi
MTHVDIYLLQDDSLDRDHYACRLIEKAYRHQHQVYVQTNSQAHAESLDELLWTFKEESFIPHNLLGEGPHKAPPVQLGTQTAPKQHRDILLHFLDDIPEACSRFSRILDVVAANEEHKAQARQRYRLYQQQQFTINTHPIG